jgi:hypothetical protein
MVSSSCRRWKPSTIRVYGSGMTNDRSLPGELAARRRREREIIGAFVRTCQGSDADAMTAAASRLDLVLDGWKRAFKRIAQLPAVDRKLQTAFLHGWVRSGDHIRDEVNDDLLLCDGLRVLMPPYTGRGRRLFRGEGAANRRRRTYGLSWSTNRPVAESFAQGPWQMTDGGSVLLETDAPPIAIFCNISAGPNRNGEAEYLVDRRRLIAVRVVARYPKRSLEEDLAAQKTLKASLS